MKKDLNQFTNLYSLSKTLKFELIPVGKTLCHIENNGIITKDKERSDSYKEMKKTIDEYHRSFIEKALSRVKLTKLEDYLKLYNVSAEDKKSRTYKNDFSAIKKELREEVTKLFESEKKEVETKADKKGEEEKEIKKIFNNLGKKELIKEDLEKWIKSQDSSLYFDAEFKNFTTYFTGYNENRKNMYSSEEKSTSIAYRIVNENLPKFIDNLKTFKKICETNISSDFEILSQELCQHINVKSIKEFFELEYFNHVLSQEQIAKYNTVIGGLTTNSVKIRGLNEYINLYNQKQSDKKLKLPKLKQLYKQILSPNVDISFLPEKFETIQELLDATSTFYNSNLLNNEKIDNSSTKNIFEKIKDLVFVLSNYDLEKIYLRNDTGLTSISQRIFGNYSFIKDAISGYYDKIINPNYQVQYEKSKNKDKKEEEKEKFTKQAYLSIKMIQDSLDLYNQSFDDSEQNSILKKGYSKSCVADYFKAYFYSQEMNDKNKQFDYISNITVRYSAVKGLLNSTYEGRELKQSDKDNLKLFLDGILEFIHFIKPLYIKNNSEFNIDDMFYGDFIPLYEQLVEFTKLYDKVRNFVTSKQYSIEKFKLNFNCSSLLSGWAQKYETNGGIIFRKGSNYYVGIIKKSLLDDDIKELENIIDTNAFQIHYDFQKPDNKNIPRTFIRSKGDSFAPAVQKYNLKINDILDIYVKGKYKTEHRKINYEEYKISLTKMIDYFKSGLIAHESYKHYKFNWKESCEYNDISEFYFDSETSCYQLKNIPINFEVLESLVEQGKIYLFKIYNKDFSDFSKGKENLHTMYWKALFDDKNLEDVIYKLNGQAEIFYREKSVSYSEEILNKGHHYELLKDKFKFPIIKDRRFTLNKFMLHVPITLNFKSNGKPKIDEMVKEYIKDNQDINIIGIDRGERHLLYLTLINQKGNMILDENGVPVQHSLNEIINRYTKDGQVIKKEVNYHSKLDIKEKERAKARENWGVIENIRELKEGYLSQVVHLISKMMVKYNAIVVLEDLNFGFKRGRFKVEKQVYQKFEKMLIDKLNYLVIKEKKSKEFGGLYHALQLTGKFESFEKLGKQSGFVFYVPAWNTSKIDPATGFVNLFDTRYRSVNESKNFFSKFDKINYNKEKDYFEFSFDYNNFTSKAEGTRTKWVLCSYGKERVVYNKNAGNGANGVYENWNITEKLKEIFNEFGISFESGSDFKSDISNNSNSKMFIKIMKCLNVLLALRYSNADNKDFILSPVADQNGHFFDSQKAAKTMPQNADANGAYHIALKGLWVLQQINKTEDVNKVKLAISNKEWLNFAQNISRS